MKRLLTSPPLLRRLLLLLNMLHSTHTRQSAPIIERPGVTTPSQYEENERYQEA